MMATLVCAGTADASPAAQTGHIQNGEIWTLQPSPQDDYPCEQLTFYTHPNTWVGDIGGDSGTWHANGPYLKVKWKAGTDKGSGFDGYWRHGAYEGSFDGYRESKLVPGALCEE